LQLDIVNGFGYFNVCDDSREIKYIKVDLARVKNYHWQKPLATIRINVTIFDFVVFQEFQGIEKWGKEKTN